MAWFQLSYDYQNSIRDVSEVFQTIVQNRPVFSSIVGGGIETAKNTKHEWLDDVAKNVSTTLTADYTAGAGSLTVADSSSFKVGDIVEFDKTSGTGFGTSTLQAKVTAIPDGVTLTIAVYGTSVDENLTTGDTAELLSRPKNEGTLPDADNGYEPVANYNYTQIFDRTALISLTSINVDKYGIGGALNYQVERQLTDISYEVDRAILRGQRIERTNSEAGTLGGVLSLLSASAESQFAAGGALTEDVLNDAFEKLRSNGALGVTTLLCHPVQGRKVSAFVANYRRVNTDNGTTIAGTVVQQFMSDQGDLVNIVMDRNMDKDKLAIVDPAKISWIALENRQFTDKDATPVGADYVARRIIGEYTLQMKNVATQHMLITGLTA